jgi:hypothetical protein
MAVGLHVSQERVLEAYGSYSTERVADDGASGVQCDNSRAGGVHEEEEFGGVPEGGEWGVEGGRGGRTLRW